jgi:hypothetical protein
MTSEHSFSRRSGIPVKPQSGYFSSPFTQVWPHRVTHTLRPYPRIRRDKTDKPKQVENSLGERVITTEDEDIVASDFSHTTYLDMGSTNCVELGNKLNKIW